MREYSVTIEKVEPTRENNDFNISGIFKNDVNICGVFKNDINICAIWK